jgi:uncharacterized membrane protein
MEPTMKITRQGQLQYRKATQVCATRCSQLLNRMLPAVGTCTLMLAVVATAVDWEELANFLFAAGLLLHLVAWFDNWSAAASRRWPK